MNKDLSAVQQKCDQCNNDILGCIFYLDNKWYCSICIREKMEERERKNSPPR